MLGVHRDGAFTEYLTVPEHFVHKAEGVSLDQAAMVEFLAIGAHAVRRAHVQRGQRVLVVGAGPIGMAAMIFAILRGAQVTALDTRQTASTSASRTWAWRPACRSAPTTTTQLAALTDDEFFDVVFDATGNPAAMERGFEFIAHGGNYVLISIVSARHHLLRPGVPQARDHAARQPQRDDRGFRDRARGDARGPYPGRR